MNTTTPTVKISSQADGSYSLSSFDIGYTIYSPIIFVQYNSTNSYAELGAPYASSFTSLSSFAN